MTATGLAGMAELLQQELVQLAHLEQLLGEEQEAMLRRNSEEMGELAKRKQALIERVEGLEGERLQRLMPNGGVAERDAWKEVLGADSRLAVQWQRLEAVLLRCRKQNQVNGVLLERDRQQTQQLLRLLLGGEGKATSTYDARGSAHASYAHGHSLKV